MGATNVDAAPAEPLTGASVIATGPPPRLARQATAEALVRALLPAGERLRAPDPRQVVGGVAGRWGRRRPARWALALGLLLLDAWALATTARPLAALPPPRAEAWLSRWGRARGVGRFLELLVLPFKVVWLEDPVVETAVDGRLKVDTPTVAERHRWEAQILDAGDAEPALELDADVVVVGTGAGGAVAAYELASAGLAVAIVEEGRLWGRHEFRGDPLKMMRKLYRYGGSTATLGNTVVPLPMGKTVGGTTTINSGTCVRTPDWVLQEWQDEGLAALTPAALAPVFDRVEAVLQVQPGAPEAVGPIGEVIARGAAELGLSGAHPLRRNAAGCDGQGVCQLGCPTGAKQSTGVSFVPRALEKNAFMFTSYRADEVLWDGRRAVGVRATGRGPDGAPRRLTVRARAVVVAMGTMLTPGFLQRNGVRSRWLGRNLSIHPCGAAWGWFPGMQFDNGRTIPQGFGVDDFMRDGYVLEGGTTPLISTGLTAPTFGRAFVERVERYQQTGAFGFLIRDTSRGRVRTLPGRRYPLMTYRMNRTDFGRFQAAMDTLARIYFRAGAREVYLGGLRRTPVLHNEAELDALWQTRLRPSDFLITAYHALGTARLSAEPARGICDAEHQVHGTEGLYVTDGAAVPSSLGVNPQITIMTLASRAAERLARRLVG